MGRTASVARDTKETRINLSIGLDGGGVYDITTGIPFFDHMLSLFAAHGFFDLTVEASGDIDVDFHHTVEDVGIVLGEAVKQALGDRAGIKRYGYATTPMDETLASAVIDLSNRPFLVYNVPSVISGETGFSVFLAKEFFRAFAVNSGMNLHINVEYGENEHHILEAVFKSVGRALDVASGLDNRISGPLSTKGAI
ncbi:MAG: imidazoleglycerol-phosphate dehydratase HisB [Thermodesulfobacteriota bacterium]|nr:imidazoleglycerol-phosphate dehydratase HisB [Thermodesulfobacteriota bacterium]